MEEMISFKLPAFMYKSEIDKLNDDCTKIQSKHSPIFNTSECSFVIESVLSEEPDMFKVELRATQYFISCFIQEQYI